MSSGRRVAIAAAAIIAAAVVAKGITTTDNTEGAAAGWTTYPRPSVAAEEIHVVGLGDSVMAGTACGCGGIPARYAARLGRRTGHGVSAVNLGVPGDTTTTLLARLDTDTAIRGTVRSASILLVITGANDLANLRAARDQHGCDVHCYQPAVDTMGQRMGMLLQKLRTLAGARPQILVGTYWNVFPDGDATRASAGQDDIDWGRDVTAAANPAICRAALAAAATCVDLSSPLLADGDPTDLLADDGDHPNAVGVDTIVTQFLNVTDSPR